MAVPFLIANANRLLDDQPVPPALDLNGKHVVVLGGGDTGMDCNRTAIRIGATSVTCVYRRDEASMPGSRREVGYGREEGVKFLFHRQPLALHGEQGRVQNVRVVITELVDGGDGRLRPRSVEGSETELRTDVVIQAFGFRPSPPAWSAAYGIVLDASGDNMRGADLIVCAVHDGREAAKSIAQLLSRTTQSQRQQPACA